MILLTPWTTPQSPFPAHFSAFKYYCDGCIILKIQARLAAIDAFITHPPVTGFNEHSGDESCDTSLTIDPKDASWAPVNDLKLQAGYDLVDDLKTSHEMYKSQKDGEDFSCYGRMPREDWALLLKDIESDAQLLYSWIIDKLYNEYEQNKAITCIFFIICLNIWQISYDLLFQICICLRSF